ncbi:3'-5' exonuclease [Aquibacillus halophilus]|uniref:3'-5' exonuclease n=1 Tax=Aquibacillus halophilus TaxID=930132 RepID=A0A6A8DPI9_9BACI|nr:3'-5' exonuclease [Aquibacillus halophilus]MRH43182.1 3'-5' exonuclease [Aquibacillus halophilus]
MLPIDLQIIKYFFFEKPIYHFKMRPYFKWSAYQELNDALLKFQKEDSLESSKLDNTPFTIFDLETTGLIPEVGHEVISIGAIQLHGLQHCRVEKFHEIIRPIRPVPNNISDLTGIEHEDIKNARPFIEVFQRFLEFSKDSILVAHPAKFDMRFLQTMLKRWRLPSYDPYVIDSQLMARWLLPGVNDQLDQLMKYYSIEQLERHHALNDAIMTAELFEILLEQTIQSNINTYTGLDNVLTPFKLNRHPAMKYYNKDWS